MPTTQAPTHPAVGQPYPQYTQQPGYQAPGQQPYTEAGYGVQGSQYQQYPEYGGYPPRPFAGGAPGAGMLDGFVGRLKQIVVNTNPILLSSLVVLVVGLGIFLLLAFQFHWIKTAQPTTTVTATDKTPPVILTTNVEPGATANSAIISWVTDEDSSSQVEYGLAPNANTYTPIQDDPTDTGGVKTHAVVLTNLIAHSTYAYKVISIDKDGNKAEHTSDFNTIQ